MRLRRGLSPLLSTLILISLAITGGLIIYSVLPGLMASLGGRLEVQVASADLIYVEDRAFFSTSIKNIGNKPAASIVVSGYDDNGKPFKLALPPADSGGTSSNTLIIPLGVSDLVLDGSGNNNHGTIHGASWTTDADMGVCLSFDGNDYVEIPGNIVDIYNPFMVEAWINPSTLSNNIGYLQMVTQDGLIRFSIGCGGSCMNSEASTPNGYDRFLWDNFNEGLTTNTFYNLIAVLDLSIDVTYLYKDGQFEFSDSINRVKWDSLGDITKIQIARGYYCHNWNGIIDEVCIYDLVSNSPDWSFNHPCLPLTDGLVLWLPFDEGSSDPFSFTVGNQYSLTVTAYSLDGSIFAETTSVKCTSQSR